MITIDISKDYTKSPGGRFIHEGAFSGEDFREKVLLPKYLETIRTGEALTVILDGGYGYAPSFLEEAFGGLVRKLKDARIADIRIISEEEPELVDNIRDYIADALKEISNEK